MKRLLDEPGDEVTRLLIRAGANHQPPRLGKFRLMAAMGLGTAIGLSTTKALAWLGTGSGKVGLAVAIVGASAGGAYVLADTAPAPASAPSARSAPIAARAEPASLAAPAALPEAVLALAAGPADTPAPLDVVPNRSSPAERPARAGSARRAARKKAVRAAVPQPPPEASKPTLSDETAWVDRLRVSAERGDRAAFEKLQDDYARQFPEGQLRPEVNRLRASL